MTSSEQAIAIRRRWHHRPVRTGLILVASLAVAGGTYAWSAVRPTPPPSTAAVVIAPPGVAQAPSDVTAPNANPGADRRSVDERIAFWTKRLDEQPSDFLSLIQLGVTYAEKGRLTADLDSYARASAAVDRALRLSPEYPPAIKARGAIRFALHDFPGAESDARGVLAKAPSDPDALAGLADALLEEGKLQEAHDTLGRLSAMASGPAVDVRLARLAYLRENRSEAVTDAQRAVNSSGDDDPTARGFYQFALGEYARLDGETEVARSAYRAALGLRANDLGALVGLARVEAASGDVDGAIARLQSAAAIAPQPETLALLGDLLATRGGDGDAAAAGDAYATVRAVRQLNETAGTVYDRSLIMFELDHGGATPDTLVAADRSEQDRPDAGGHDLLAWAHYRLGDYTEAQDEMSAALSTGIEDGRMLFHAGAIDLALGAVDDGKALIREALALGPALGPRDTSEARTLLAN